MWAMPPRRIGRTAGRSFRIDDSLYDPALEQAERDGTPLVNIIREALHTFLLLAPGIYHAAAEKAAKSGRTLAEVVAEMVTRYAESPAPEPSQESSPEPPPEP